MFDNLNRFLARVLMKSFWKFEIGKYLEENAEDKFKRTEVALVSCDGTPCLRITIKGVRYDILLVDLMDIQQIRKRIMFLGYKLKQTAVLEFNSQEEAEFVAIEISDHLQAYKQANSCDPKDRMIDVCFFDNLDEVLQSVANVQEICDRSMKLTTMNRNH
jgi:hypothetical protein